MSRRIDRAVKGALDPVLQSALEMEQRAIVPARAWANDIAGALTIALESIAEGAEHESDRESAAQLMHVAEAFGACVVSLVAYSRGVVPKVRENARIVM